MNINSIIIAMVLAITLVIVAGCTPDQKALNAAEQQEMEIEGEGVKAAPSIQECEELEEKSIEAIKKGGMLALWEECEEIERAMEDSSDKVSEQHEESDEGVEEKATQPTMFAKNYYRYDEAHFRQSLTEGKIIFLDFHADWCPICINERPGILQAFNELDGLNVVGYEVHFNDKQTSDADNFVIKEYQITYQHTKVILKDGKVALKTLEKWTKTDVLEKIREVKDGQ